VEHRPSLPNEWWLWANRHRVQVLHLHWLHMLYAFGRLTPFRFVRYVEKLVLAGLLGYRIVWTVHNTQAHEQGHPLIDRLARLLTATRADGMIVHCEYARQEVARRFSRHDDLFVVPLGNYGSVYPGSPPRDEARRELGIDESAFVYLYFGQVRPYKGVERLIHSFARLDASDAHLLVFGTCPDEEEKNALIEAAQRDRRIQAVLEHVPGDGVPRLFSAANVVVAPFLRILTSSSVMTAFSFRRPVIVPALGCLPELVTPDMGILYDPRSEDALLGALRDIRHHDLERMGESAYAHSVRFDWARTALETKQVYCRVLNGQG
jgi:beta-1,4-mannosyltransferase